MSEASEPEPQVSDHGDDAAALERSLTQMSLLVMGVEDGGFEKLLEHVAAFALRAIPGADGAGLTLLEEGRPDVRVGTADFVREVDDIQYGLGQGPCITAAAEGRTQMSGSLRKERSWPRFGPRVAMLGVRSVLSLPLLGPSGVLGAINVYARAEDAFDDHAVELGELFAVPAAISVLNAQLLAQTKRAATQLHAALKSRAAIDQAMGIIMSRAGCTADEAFQKLVTRSQSENRKLFAVAQQMLDEAVRNARARRSQ
jgi:GAF domain-containing protein